MMAVRLAVNPLLIVARMMCTAIRKSGEERLWTSFLETEEEFY